MTLSIVTALIAGIVIGVIGFAIIQLIGRSKAEKYLGIVSTMSRRDEPRTIEEYSAVTSYVFNELELGHWLETFRFRLKNQNLSTLVNHLAQNWSEEIITQYPWNQEVLDILTDKVADVSAENAIDVLLKNHGLYLHSGPSQIQQWHRHYLDELTKKDFDKEILLSFFQECWELRSMDGAQRRLVAGVLARKTELLALSELLKLYKALDDDSSSHTLNKRRVAEAIARRNWMADLDRDTFREMVKIVASVFKDEETHKSALTDNLATAAPERLIWLLGDAAALCSEQGQTKGVSLLMSMVLDKLSQHDSLSEDLERDLYMIAASYSEDIGGEIVSRIIEIGWPWPQT